MIIRHDHESHFTVIPNAILQDPAIDFRAKGLLVYLLSLPENWDIKMVHIANTMPDSMRQIRHGFDDLIRAGYVVRRREYSKDHGRPMVMCWVTDDPGNFDRKFLGNNEN